MRSTSAAILLVILVLLPIHSHAQSTAVPFLLISPSAQANGMGESSVADHTDDAFAALANPAHLGMLVRSDYFSGGYVKTDWLPGFGLPNLTYTVYAANAGIDLKSVWKDAPALSVGMGYSNIHFNLGTFAIVSETGPEVIDRFDAWENSDQYSFGVGYESVIRVSAGMGVKYIQSTLPPTGPGVSPNSGSAKTTLYDYGFLLDVPLVDVWLKLANPFLPRTDFTMPYVDVSFGFSKNNLGPESLTYIDQAQADPLPRYARAGMGVDLGLVLNKYDLSWKPLSFKWSIEAGDLLVERDSLHTQYQSGWGDISFFKEVVLGRTNTRTEKKRGWEVNFLEIAMLRGGRFEEDPIVGGRRFETKGWGIRFGGFAKILKALYTPNEVDGILRFLVDKVDVRFDHSEWRTDDANSPLSGTKFDSVSLAIIH